MERGYGGKGLEKIIERFRAPGVVLHRIHDARAFGNYKGPRVPCDYFGSVRGHPTLLECKETEGSSIPFSLLTRPKSRHQLDEMLRFERAHPHNRAGYLCMLREGFVFVPPHLISGEGSIRAHASYRYLPHGVLFDLPWLILGS